MHSSSADSSLRSKPGSIRQNTSGTRTTYPSAASRSASPRMLSLIPKISWNSRMPGPGRVGDGAVRREGAAVGRGHGLGAGCRHGRSVGPGSRPTVRPAGARGPDPAPDRAGLPPAAPAGRPLRRRLRVLRLPLPGRPAGGRARAASRRPDRRAEAPLRGDRGAGLRGRLFELGYLVVAEDGTTRSAPVPGDLQRLLDQRHGRAVEGFTPGRARHVAAHRAHHRGAERGTAGAARVAADV